MASESLRVRVTPQLLGRLKKAANAAGGGMSDVVRAALEAHLSFPPPAPCAQAPVARQVVPNAGEAILLDHHVGELLAIARRIEASINQGARDARAQHQLVAQRLDMIGQAVGLPAANTRR